jgi:pimeloyl-ACP methyl ester carboxylesterase
MMDRTDEELGLTHHTARANDVLLHYTVTGAGDPVVLLHGFAQTWYEWRARVIPALAERYTVIAPDMRGVGDSDRPLDGYDKKTMAEDIYQLVHDHLGHRRVLLVGHDFGAMVAYRYAADHRDAVRRLVILETIMPGFGYEDAMRHPFAQDGLGRLVWHLAFHDAPDIPEALIAGRERLYLRWFHKNFSYNPAAISEADLDEYERHYSAPGGLRALNYYRTHYVDAEHNRASAKDPLEIPVLALGGEAFLGPIVKQGMEALASDVRGGVIPECGHWVPDERPDHLIDQLLAFFEEEAGARVAAA